MALMDFIKKQFIDIIEWVEREDGVLAWRFPVADREIQYGASLTVRETQMAVFVNEGKIADVFGPGMYKLTTQTLPVLTYLKNWDKLFQSPFKSDVYFFSTRQQLDQRWGTLAAGDDSRQGLRRRAAARLRQLRVPPRRPETVPHAGLGHARELHRGRARRPVARADAATHLGCGGRIGHAVPRPRGQPGRVRAGAAQRDGAGIRGDRPEARRCHGAERFAARGAAEDPRPEDRHGHGRRRHGQVHAVPDRAVAAEVRRRIRARQRHRGRRDGARRGRCARPGDGQSTVEGLAGRKRRMQRPLSLRACGPTR